MAIPIISYALDPTGKSPDNLVSGESVTISGVTDNKFLIVPKHGYFFTETFSLESGGTPIARDKYKFTEYYHKASLKYGKQICGSILVDVTGLSGDLVYSYQVLGGDNSRSTSNLIEVFYDRLQPMETVVWDGLRDRPEQYKPKSHLHNLSELHDLGRILSYLENIRDAILVLEFPEYNTLMKYIDEMLTLMQDRSTQFLQEKIPALIQEFKAQFTKEYFGLDKLVNMACSNDRDGYLAGGENYKINDIAVNKYLTLSSLVMFKEALYEGLIDKFSTNIGTNDLKFVNPVRTNLLNIPVGGNVSYIGQDIADNNGISFSADIYPTGSIGRRHLTAVKISSYNDPNSNIDLRAKHQGSLVLGVDHSDYGIWLGHHVTNAVADQFRWNQFLVDGSLDSVVRPLHSHVRDKFNPHKLTKNQVDLLYVENLPVVTKEVIRVMRAERMYLTMDRLLEIMTFFGLQDYWMIDVVEEDFRNRFHLDNCQVVYSPCGDCGCDDRSDFKTVEKTEECPEKGTVLRGVCISGDWSEIEFQYKPSSKPIPDSSKRGTFEGYITDGNCGETYLSVDESEYCDASDIIIREVCSYDGLPDWEPGKYINREGKHGILKYVMKQGSYGDIVIHTDENQGVDNCQLEPSPKDTIINERCDGTTRIVEYSDGVGGIYDKREEKSRKCGYIDWATVPETRTINYYIAKTYDISAGTPPGDWLLESRDEKFNLKGAVTARVYPKTNDPTTLYYTVNWEGGIKVAHPKSTQIHHAYYSPEQKKGSPVWELIRGSGEETFMGSIRTLSWTDPDLAIYQIANPPPDEKTAEYCLGPDLYGMYSGANYTKVKLEQANSATCKLSTGGAMFIRASNTLGSGCFAIPDGTGGYYVDISKPAGVTRPSSSEINITSRKIKVYEIKASEPFQEFPYPKTGSWLDNAIIQIDSALQIYIEAMERRILVDAGPTWGSYGDSWTWDPPLRTFFAWCVPSMGLYSDWEMASQHALNYKGRYFFRSQIPANAFNAPDLRIIRAGGI